MKNRKYIGNFSTPSCNGFVGGIIDYNIKRLAKQLREIGTGYGHGHYWIEDDCGMVVKEGKF